MGRIKVFAQTLWLLFTLILSHDAFSQSSFATAKANMLDSGLMNAHYTITSNHTAFIFNSTTIDSPFLYAFVLCASNHQCTTYAFTAYVVAHQGINVSFIVNKDVMYPLPGRYTMTAKSIITGPSTSVYAENTAPIRIIDPNVLPPP